MYSEADTFLDVSRAVGVVNNRRPGKQMAIGQAWGDYNGDGWIDLYVTDPEGPNTLYQNNGDGTFSVSPYSEQVALPRMLSGGAVFVDYDNDGWKDLYVVNWGENRLYRNLDGEGFENVTAIAGVGDPSNGQSASWGDYDQDGYLDLYVANWACYPDCGRPSEGDYDKLYRNNGDGTFTDVTRLLGIGITGSGFIASFVDYDNDGDLDIYLINDEFIHPIGNKLWRNDGPGCNGWCFKEVSKDAGANTKVFGMGLAIGDYDNDGHLDFYFSNAGPMVLLHNQGDGTFVNMAVEAGVDHPIGIAWGTVFFDYDNDGWQDLYLAVANTTTSRDIAANPLFRNNGDGTFTRVACGMGAADVRASMGVAYADYDQDGWMDLVVGNMDEGYRVYRNQMGAYSQANWLGIELVGGGPVNRDAVGTRIYLTTEDGLTQMKDVILGSSLGAGNELALHFGLGEAEVADLTVRWPDGTVQVIEDVAANYRYQLKYPLIEESELEVLYAGVKPTQPIVSAGGGSFMAFGDVSGVVVFILSLTLGGVLAVGWFFLRTSEIKMQVQPGWVGLVVVGLGITALLGAGALALSGGLGAASSTGKMNIDAQVAALMTAADVTVLETPPQRPELVALGEALFWDPELSGNRDTTCATCHHPLFGTGDGLSLPVGTTGGGLGNTRALGQGRDFVPRNAPPLYNLGYPEWTVFFWDGRARIDPHTGVENPASDRLPPGLDNLLAVQAMFPVTSRDEMRGFSGNKDIFGEPNELVVYLDYELRLVWAALTERLLKIPGYVTLFQAAYPDVPLDEIGFQHAANAMAAYQIDAFTFEDSPFDRYISGELDAFTEQQKQGALLFYGEAGCASCHSGGLTTDLKFHNLAVPQFGPGKGREQPLDMGRARETGEDCDRFAFRTPPLRNVALTAPYMHNGAFVTLEAAVRHHLTPSEGLLFYDLNQLHPELKDTCQEAPEVLDAILSTHRLGASRAELTDEEMAALLAFLHAFTSPSAEDLGHIIPASVPSGLTVGGN